MRSTNLLVFLALVACSDKAERLAITIPKIYPPVRASTPSALIADPTYASASVGETKSALTGVAALPQPLGGEINLALAIQERLYTMGPTEILRIVHELDDSTAELDTNSAKHPCLTTTPIVQTYSLPGGQTFSAKLQCLQQSGDIWIAFGFDKALAADGGSAADGGDFYFVEGQAGGMGGAYHVNTATGDVEAWISVADSTAPNNSQVIMHLLTTPDHTVELSLAGSGVGFCSAHLKADPDHLFIRAKTNGAPPPGTPMTGPQYCDASRDGCFAVSALDTDLGGDASDCAPVAATTFGIAGELDASGDPGANVTPSSIYMIFNQMPTGVPAF